MLLTVLTYQFPDKLKSSNNYNSQKIGLTGLCKGKVVFTYLSFTRLHTLRGFTGRPVDLLETVSTYSINSAVGNPTKL